MVIVNAHHPCHPLVHSDPTPRLKAMDVDVDCADILCSGSTTSPYTEELLQEPSRQYCQKPRLSLREKNMVGSSV